MAKVLLVEDDEDKREQIINFINKFDDYDLIEVRSYNSAVKAIRSSFFDLILLDMTLPTFDVNVNESGGRTQAFGGELILAEMDRKNISSKVIVITQFDLFGEGEEEINLENLDQRLKLQFNNYLGAIQYSVSYNSWQEILKRKIQKINLL
ncbi:response regulator [Empedobacter brevis]|uniref:Response regulator n=1 Tax=Empedobacter brevis TaxID=247 RepID=A0AAJ1QDQ3_9FLAO|nr:response regulator [Empedobacter brevis]MDM1072149.1 response regulator [Empedobacter brevis]